MNPKDLSIFAVVFGLVVLSFSAASGYVRYRTRAIDQAALDISENASPSILHISKARVEIQHLQLEAERELDVADAGRVPSHAELAASFSRLHQEIQLYQELPLFVGERGLWEEANRELGYMDRAFRDFVSLLAARRLVEARQAASGPLRDACLLTGTALLSTIEFNAEQAHDRAQRIRQMRISVNHSSWVLNLLCVLWTVVALCGLGFSYHRQSLLREEQRRIVEARAAELEQFAGRVAHDILNPLSVVTFALTGLDRLAGEEQRQNLLARGRANIKRAVQILDGLLAFARAGARPEPGASAELNEVMRELEAELRTQASEANIELTLLPFLPCRVACSPGILLSLVSNLAHNAIKYTRGETGRQIILRVVERKSAVRIEVEDNGPGLSPELEQAVFEPFVRAPGSAAPGFGLGLATVKKAAEAHGGKVGVRSIVGKGCVFWFELPTRESSSPGG